LRDSFERVSASVVACERCPRLTAWCREVAATKTRRFRDQDYWGKPVPGFGDPRARLLVVGLAPAAHGGNRTGRVFTGDRSGDFLFAALHRKGFASQAASLGRDDGLTLRDCYIAPVVRCAPPANRPAPDEIARCREYLARELALLQALRAVLCLGRIAQDGFVDTLRELGRLPARRRLAFGHGLVHDLGGGLRLFSSYHVSQQNTFTGRLTAAGFDAVLKAIRRHLATVALWVVAALFSPAASADVRYASFRAQSVGREVAVAVQVPPSYEASPKRRYPVVYALHGLFESEAFWEKRGLAARLDQLWARGGLPEFLVVVVDGGNSFFVNAPAGRYEDLVTRDLVAWAEAQWRVAPGREARALWGVSMGGYAALRIALTHPEEFAAVATHSAMLLERMPAPEDGAGSWQMNAFWGVFGKPIDDRLWAANDPLRLAAKADAKAVPALRFDCGQQDRYGLFRGHADLHEALEARGVRHEFALYPGDHGYEYVLSVLDKSLAFLGAALTPRR
jgi:uracil-DNA glycosylase family 4